MSPRHVHAAAFTVPLIAHLGQAAALQVVATALEMPLGNQVRALSAVLELDGLE